MQGTYVFVEASNGRATDTAHWISPTLRQSAAGCSMRFWYHMNGIGIGTLYVYLKVSVMVNHDKLIHVINH